MRRYRAYGLPKVVGTHGYIVSNVNDARKNIKQTLLEDSKNIDLVSSHFIVGATWV